MDSPLSSPGVDSSDRFYYFAYGSCMCPVDLKRSLGESTHAYVVGPATLAEYRLGFFRRSRLRNCGVLDVVPEASSTVQGVLYHLPWRLSPALDRREEGYCHERVTVTANGQAYAKTRTYSVISKTHEEIAPNEWYSSVVMRGAATCGLPEQYCWELFHHMHSLQRRQAPASLRRTA
ncbi:MAG: gamma-glutamylcyclotransferase [Leptolyngbya sp.]|jgi:cation transport regulator ChaC|uniref:Gamma-glutamylcyclotransferase n=1 Tax=Shackletoniella antarctica TaxID=268115 RepID=A0A2W4VXA0_9CYAN|nr:MAG: gamma-glutamylcyclotransferase [Shackletoniella antarctica]PZV15232.1 MAG: gamma-glutamylcyclotransferase [Leptolyngbya sp.]